jgi:cobalt/nickel transport protein
MACALGGCELSSMRRRVTLGAFVAVGLAAALALAFFVSPHAANDPDGLNKVAIDEGFADQETSHAFESVPTAGYAVDAIHDDQLSTGVAGVIGVAVTFVLAAGLTLVVRRTRSRATSAA